MPSREIDIQIIAGRSEAGDDFEAALRALAGISRRVSVSSGAAQLIRDERDWLADRPVGASLVRRHHPLA